MKIAAETALAAWAVFTAWLIMYLLVERCQHLGLVGDDSGTVFELVGGALAVILFPNIRKRFAAWLAKRHDPA